MTTVKDGFLFAVGLESWGNFDFFTNIQNWTWVYLEFGLEVTPCIPIQNYNYDSSNNIDLNFLE